MAFLTLFQVSTGDNWNGIMKVPPPLLPPQDQSILVLPPLVLIILAAAAEEESGRRLISSSGSQGAAGDPVAVLFPPITAAPETCFPSACFLHQISKPAKKKPDAVQSNLVKGHQHEPRLLCSLSFFALRPLPLPPRTPYGSALRAAQGERTAATRGCRSSRRSTLCRSC